MCVPGASQAPDSTGVCELVATTTTSAPRTASSADAAARIPNCRAKEALVLGDRQHHAHGLNDLAARQVGHRLRHGGDQILHLQEIVHRLLVEDHRRPNQCLSSMLCPSGSRISALEYSPSRTLGPQVI